MTSFSSYLIFFMDFRERTWRGRVSAVSIPPARNLNHLDLETFVEVCLVSVHLFLHMLALMDCTARQTHISEARSSGYEDD